MVLFVVARNVACRLCYRNINSKFPIWWLSFRNSFLSFAFPFLRRLFLIRFRAWNRYDQDAETTSSYFTRRGPRVWLSWRSTAWNDDEDEDGQEKSVEEERGKRSKGEEMKGTRHIRSRSAGRSFPHYVCALRTESRAERCDVISFSSGCFFFRPYDHRCNTATMYIHTRLHDSRRFYVESYTRTVARLINIRTL